MMSALDRKWSSIYASSHNRRIIKSLQSASVGLGWSMPDSNEHDRHRKGRLIRVKLACGRRKLASSGMSGTSRTESSRVRSSARAAGAPEACGAPPGQGGPHGLGALERHKASCRERHRRRLGTSSASRRHPTGFRRGSVRQAHIGTPRHPKQNPRRVREFPPCAVPRRRAKSGCLDSRRER